MSRQLGDFVTSTVVHFNFTTFRPSTGASFTLGGTPAVAVYKDGSTTESTSGITLTVDFDGRTGMHHVAIDTSSDGTFYAAGSFFDVVITAGTVDSVSVVGAVVGGFTLQKTSPLRPATAGRTLVVDASGLADANVVKLGPTGSGTAQTARDVGASVLVGDKTGFSLSSGGVQAIWDAATSGLTTLGSIGKWILDHLDVVLSTRLATSGYTAPPSSATISAAVVDQALSGHTTSGTVGKALSDASAGGDPWDVTLPGAYASGKAGNILGNNLDAAVSSIPTANANADALLDRSNGVETGYTLRQALRLVLSSVAGKLSGAAGTTVTIRNVPDTKSRITATVDTSGNRSAVTYDVT